LIYQKNYKKILLNYHLQNFSSTISNKIWENSDIFNKLKECLLIDNYSELALDEAFEMLHHKKNGKENFRRENEYTPLKNSKMSKVMSDLMTSTSIKNIFEDPYYVDASQRERVYQHENNENSKHTKQNEMEIIPIEESALYINSGHDSSTALAKDQYQMIIKELQVNIDR
jgi:hypothetical protein